MTNLYQNAALLRFTKIVPKMTDHVALFRVGLGDRVKTDPMLNDFERQYSDNKVLSLDNQWREKFADSKQLMAENLDLTGGAFSDFVENDIPTIITDYYQDAVDNLVAPVEDKTIEEPPSPIPSGDTITQVLRKAGQNSNDINSKMLEALDFQNTLLQNQNQMIRQRNEIEAQKVKLMMEKQSGDYAKDQLVTQGITAMAQALQYLPSLVETFATASDRQAELGNVANSHALQKNINDAYEFKYDKTAEDGLRTSAKKQADLSVINKEQIEEENGIMDSLISAADNATEYVLDVVGLGDFDIFTHLINETLPESKGGKK